MRAVIADDDPLTTTILSLALREWGFDVTSTSDGASAWQALTDGPAPELAIIDWMMPGMDGVDICRGIRQNPALAGMYVLLLTGRGSRGDLVAGLDAGADDYMVKPINREELRARVQVGMRVATLQARLADRVTELQAAKNHLAHLANTDVLTNVYSRRGWFELAAAEFSRSRRHGHVFSLLVLDLDFFKRVNDTFGHEAGDRVLCAFADLLRRECRQSDVIGRLGGEEFVLLAPETSRTDAQLLAGRIRDAFHDLVVDTLAGPVRCSCSIGITDGAPGDDHIESVLRRADAALYEAKHSGRDCWKTHHFGAG